MKVAILTGGLGEAPLTEIGGHPALWHLLKHCDRFDHDRFVFALGDEGLAIKRHFVEACSLASDMTIHLGAGRVLPHERSLPPWQVELIDTGRDTASGHRLRRLAPYLDRETFLCTQGNTLSNVDLDRLLEFHRTHGKLMTLTAVRPEPVPGALELGRGGRVAKLETASQPGDPWQNGAFYVCEPGVFDYLESDGTRLEAEALGALAADDQLMAYRHEGFWHSIEPRNPVDRLDALWTHGHAPWKVWRD